MRNEDWTKPQDRGVERKPSMSLPSRYRTCRKHQSFVSATTTHSTIMNDLVLTLAIRWLPAVDAFAASCVSHEWQDALASDRDNGELWKQVCKNSNPLVTAKVQQQGVDFCRLALGLMDPDARSIQPKSSIQSTLAQATLRPEDIFAVIDLYRKNRLGADRMRFQREIMASWVCPVSNDGTIEANNINEQDKVILKGENPYADSIRDSDEVEAWQERATGRETMPQFFAAWDLFGASWFGGFYPVFGVRVTLFRRPDFKSVCVMDEIQWKWSETRPRVTSQYKIKFKSNKSLLKFADGEAGRDAKAMMYDLDFSVLELNGHLTAETNMASPGSDEEAPWLAKCRRAVARGGAYRPDRDDQIALSGVSHFEFKVALKLMFQLHSHIDDRTFDFPWNENVMVALEGLRWK